MEKAVKIVSVLLVLVLILGCVLFVKHFTMDFTEDLVTFYLVESEKELMHNSIGNDFSRKYEFEVYDMLSLFNKSGWTYKIKLLEEFRFEIDGEVHWMSEVELKKLFGVKVTDDVLDIDFEQSIYEMLAAYYDVEVSSVYVVPPQRGLDVVSLLFYSANGENSIKISGTFGGLEEIYIEATELEIEPPEVIF